MELTYLVHARVMIRRLWAPSLRRFLWMFVAGGLLLPLRVGFGSLLEDEARLLLELGGGESLEEALLVDQGIRAGWARTDPVIRARLVDNLRWAGIGVSLTEDALIEEALRLGMDRGDPLVRRRLIVRGRSLLEKVDEPSETQLRDYVDMHAQEFRVPAVYRLQQELKKEGDEQGSSLAALGAELAGTAKQIEARLGAEFVLGLRRMQVGELAELRSVYGVHRVRLMELKEERPAEFEILRARARQRWMEEKKAETYERRLAELQASYEIRSGP